MPENSKTQPEGMKPNRPCELGRQLGTELARLTDVALADIQRLDPSFKDERCKSCAFKAGTFPNGCAPTVMDAMFCAVNAMPFSCHREFDAKGDPVHMCAGWLIAIGGHLKMEPGAVDAINTYGEKRFAEKAGAEQ